MVMQFGYSTLFSAAFPMAPILALVNNFVEIRIDAWKLLELNRRAEPSGTEDIGTWMDILDLICNASIVTNGFLIFYIGSAYVNYTCVQRRVGP